MTVSRQVKKTTETSPSLRSIQALSVGSVTKRLLEVNPNLQTVELAAIIRNSIIKTDQNESVDEAKAIRLAKELLS